MSTTVIHSAKLTESCYSPEQGITLFCRVWEPEFPLDQQSDSLKTLFLIHGACEHGGRYDNFVTHAVEMGWRVIAPDLRGHGNSTGDFVHVDQFSQFTEDIRFLMHAMGCSPQQTVVVGCSMGGLIAIRSAQMQAESKSNPLCCGVVLLSPFLGLKLPVPAWKVFAGKLLSRLRPKTRFRTMIDPRELTHDEEALKIRAADHLIRQAVSARWFIESSRATKNAFAEIEHFSLPTLILQSGADYIVDPLAAKAWAELVQSKHPHIVMEFQMLSGWYHEVLREVHWEQAAKTVLDFAELQVENGEKQSTNLRIVDYAI